MKTTGRSYDFRRAMLIRASCSRATTPLTPSSITILRMFPTLSGVLICTAAAPPPC